MSTTTEKLWEATRTMPEPLLADTCRGGFVVPVPLVTDLDPLRNASLLKNLIGKVARHDRHRHWESCSGNGAVPNLVTAFAVAYKRATIINI